MGKIHRHKHDGNTSHQIVFGEEPFQGLLIAQHVPSPMIVVLMCMVQPSMHVVCVDHALVCATRWDAAKRADCMMSCSVNDVQFCALLLGIDRNGVANRQAKKTGGAVVASFSIFSCFPLLIPHPTLAYILHDIPRHAHMPLQGSTMQTHSRMPHLIIMLVLAASTIHAAAPTMLPAFYGIQAR